MNVVPSTQQPAPVCSSLCMPETEPPTAAGALADTQISLCWFAPILSTAARRTSHVRRGFGTYCIGPMRSSVHAPPSVLHPTRCFSQVGHGLTLWT